MTGMARRKQRYETIEEYNLEQERRIPVNAWLTDDKKHRARGCPHIELWDERPTNEEIEESLKRGIEPVPIEKFGHLRHRRMRLPYPMERFLAVIDDGMGE